MSQPGPPKYLRGKTFLQWFLVFEVLHFRCLRGFWLRLCVHVKAMCDILINGAILCLRLNIPLYQIGQIEGNGPLQTENNLTY